MRTVEERALEFIAGLPTLIKPYANPKTVIALLKEQHEITRQACAETVRSVNNYSTKAEIEGICEAIMNTEAV